MPPLKMAEAFYIGGGPDALDALTAKVATGGHLMDADDLAYAQSVRDYF